MTINKVAKVELHCHVDGMLNPGILKGMLLKGLTSMKIEDLEGAYPVLCFDDFINWYNKTNPHFKNLPDYKPIVSHHMQNLGTQNVIYAELMIPSGSLPIDEEEMLDCVQEFREYTTAMENGKVQIEYIVAFGRNKTPQQVEERADRILKLYDSHLICGVAVAGPEQGNPIKPFRKTFERFKEAGIGIEIHAGEWCGPESVSDALADGFPNRIGHGVSLFKNPDLIKIVQERQIHIEMCPTSNLKTGSVDDIKNHPIKKAFDLGFNFSINTDDPGPFECTMESEFRLLHDTFGFGEHEFEGIKGNSLKSRFQKQLKYSQSR